MNRAMQLIDGMFEAGPAAPAPPPTKTPTKTPTAPPAPSKPRPGTRPWQPSRRPGTVPKPKARGEEGPVQHGFISPSPKATHYSFAEAEGEVAVPPPPASEEPGGPEPSPMSSVCDIIRNGDRVTILTSQGSRLTGRATMRNRQHGCWVLNLGGPHGTPGIADDENTIKVTRGGKVIYGKI